jgi:ubiquinone/menaquinone biosynthesis C-methylase UbiE
LVVCTGVLTSGHVGPNAIKEMIRVVKPGGYFICSIAQSIFKKNGLKKKSKIFMRF